ncbi:MAG TPA: serine/threonine-protein kinase [Thermoanaerobaculia bacterium]
MPPFDTRQPHELSPGDTLGSYTVQRSIGAGGEAILYAAYDERNRKRVALKFPRVANAESIQRLRHEVAMGHEIHHPNVCKSERVATEDGFTFGVMEYVEGENLKTILGRRRGPLPRNTAERVATELCAGVSQMHLSELVHRDLKPANIMLDDQGHVKIIDLGVAEFEGRGINEFFGTPEYMAPEQLRCEVLRRPVDIFAIGVLLYEIFTGLQWLRCDPAIASDPRLSAAQRFAIQVQSVVRQQAVLPALPSAVNPELDFNVDDLLMSCLNTHPTERPKADVLRARWEILVQA